jgi:hypothetical protein
MASGYMFGGSMNIRQEAEGDKIKYIVSIPRDVRKSGLRVKCFSGKISICYMTGRKKEGADLCEWRSERGFCSFTLPGGAGANIQGLLDKEGELVLLMDKSGGEGEVEVPVTSSLQELPDALSPEQICPCPGKKCQRQECSKCPPGQCKCPVQSSGAVCSKECSCKKQCASGQCRCPEECKSCPGQCCRGFSPQCDCQLKKGCPHKGECCKEGKCTEAEK